jgi:DnaK suppressor protein
VVTSHLSEQQRSELRASLERLLEVEDQRIAQLAADGQPPSAAHDHLELAATVRAALDRMDAGVYGSGSTCQGPLPVERLEAIPYAKDCVACQQRPRAAFG